MCENVCMQISVRHDDTTMFQFSLFMPLCHLFNTNKRAAGTEEGHGKREKESQVQTLFIHSFK